MVQESSSRERAAAKCSPPFSYPPGCSGGQAQALSVLPVNVFLSPGQTATSLTVTNTGSSETAIQIRAYAWSQKDGDDPLTATDDVLLSPPLVKIGARRLPGRTSHFAQGAEGTRGNLSYFIDQIPPPSEPGIVNIVLRLSIPIFAKPAGSLPSRSGVSH